MTHDIEDVADDLIELQEGIAAGRNSPADLSKVIKSMSSDELESLFFVVFRRANMIEEEAADMIDDVLSAPRPH